MDQEKKIIEQVIHQEDANESPKPKLPPIEIDISMPPKQLFGGCTTPQKTEWPELVGLSAEEAEIKIKKDMPEAIVKIVPQDSFVTMDFQTQRVRIFVDSFNVVVSAPRIG